MLARLVREHADFGYAQYAFISKMARPWIDEGLRLILQTGCKRIIVCPLLLFPGTYLENIMFEAEKVRHNAEILVTDTLGNTDLMLNLLDQRLTEIINGDVDLIAELPDTAEPRRDFSDG